MIKKLVIKDEGKDDAIFIAETLAKHTTAINDIIDTINDQEKKIEDLDNRIEKIEHFLVI